MAEAIGEGHCSVDELLDRYDWFGIPHFQRGLVWDHGAVTLLLESLYFGTPCGSILPWKPDDPQSHGVALGKDAQTGLQHLIVDGQQRIRSLQGVFGGDETDRGGDVEPGDESVELASNGTWPSDARVWCLNLAQLPGGKPVKFKEEFEEAERLRLFGLHRDPLTPASAEAERPDRKQRRALIPIKCFLEQPSDRDRLENSHGTTAVHPSCEWTALKFR